MNPHIPHHKVVMIPRASIISESEVYISITVLSAMLTSLHSNANQELLKSSSVIKVATIKKYSGAAHPRYRLKLKYPLPFPVSYG